MNLFNRIVVMILCLALIAAAIGLIAIAWSIPSDAINALRDAATWLDDHDQDLEKTLLTTGGALIGLLALVLLIAELAPSSGTDVKVTDLHVGDAVLSTAAISQRVEEAVRQVPNVAEARVIVKAKRKGVLVSLDLHVDPDANLAAVTDEACQAASDVLTERVHVALAAPPRARLHYRELRLRGRPAAKPATPASPIEPSTPEPPVEPIPPQATELHADQAEAAAVASSAAPVVGATPERNPDP